MNLKSAVRFKFLWRRFVIGALLFIPGVLAARGWITLHEYLMGAMVVIGAILIYASLDFTVEQKGEGNGQ